MSARHWVRALLWCAVIAVLTAVCLYAVREQNVLHTYEQQITDYQLPDTGAFQ